MDFVSVAGNLFHGENAHSDPSTARWAQIGGRIVEAMADVMNAVHLHLVWSTYDRHPKLTPFVREAAYRQIAAASDFLGCDVKAIGGVEDHVHVVVQFVTTVSIGDLVKRMKGTSAHFLNQNVPECEKSFKWQGGYGVFPVEPDSLPYVIAYVEGQEEHHKSRNLDTRYEQVEQNGPWNKFPAKTTKSTFVD